MPSDQQPSVADTPVRVLVPASMGHRLVARIVDMVAVLTWMFALAIAHILIHLQLWSDSVTPEPWGDWFLAMVTFVVLYGIYEIAFIARTGSTPGKDLLGVEVVDHQTGLSPRLSQSIMRWLPMGLMQPIPLWWLGALFTGMIGATGLADAERRGIHDRMAGTRVVIKELPATEEGRAARRRAFTPRLIDPFAVFRIARSNPEALRRHPHESDH